MTSSLSIILVAVLFSLTLTSLLLFALLKLQARYQRPANGTNVDLEKSVSYSRSDTASPIPEIRITFPDEDATVKEDGKRTSKVMIVKIGESGAAYVTELPAYDGFSTVDTETIGGLREHKLKDSSDKTQL